MANLQNIGDTSKKIAERIRDKQPEINDLIYERIAGNQLPDSIEAILDKSADNVKRRRRLPEKESKEKRIERLKQEIQDLNKRGQQSYKTENHQYRDRTLEEVGVDLDKLIWEKEEEIMRLEKELNGASNFSQNVQEVTVQTVAGESQSPAPELEPATVEAGQDVEAQRAESVAKSASLDELRSVIEKIGSVKSDHQEKYFFDEQKDRITAVEMVFESDPNKAALTRESLLHDKLILGITDVYGIQDKVVDLLLEMSEKNKPAQAPVRRMEDVLREKEAERQKEVDGQTVDYYRDPKGNVHVKEEKMDLSTPELRQKYLDTQSVDHYRDPKANERAIELHRLEQAVAEARMAYARKDYETTNVVNLLKSSKIGKFFKLKAEDVSDNESYHEAYQTALRELLKHQTGQLRDQNLSPENIKEEADKLMNYYKCDEKINLYEARTQARAQVLEDKFGRGAGRPAGWLMNKAKGLFHWYQRSEGEGATGFAKTSLKKALVTVGITSTGLALSSVTGVAAAGAGAVVAARALGGTAAGVGYARMMESRYRNKEAGKLEKEKSEIAKELETAANPEELFDKLTGKLEAEMGGYKNDLRRELRNAATRKTIGLTLGAVTTIAMPSVLHWLGEKTGATEMLSGAFHKSVEYFSDLIGESYRHGLAINTRIWGGMLDKNGQVQHIAPSPGNHAAAHVSTPESPIHHVTPKNISPREVSPQVHPVNHHSVSPKGSEGPSQVTPRNASPGAHEAAKNISSTVEVQKGDKVWSLINKQLETRYGNAYEHLDPARKTYVIDALKDKVAAHPDQFGLKDIDKIKIGQKINLGKLFENNDQVKNIFDHAHNLKQAALDHILKDNKSIAHWMEAHPGHALDSKAVEHILHGNGAGAHQAASHAAEAAKTHVAANAGSVHHSVPPPSRNFGATGSHPSAAEVTRELHRTWGTAPNVEYAPAGLPPIEFVSGYAPPPPPAWFDVNYIFHPIHHFHSWNEYHGFISDARRFGFGPRDNAATRGLKIMQKMAGGKHDQWSQMRDLSFDQAKNKMGARIGNQMNRLVNWHRQLLGPQANPRGNEKVFDWAKRMAELSVRRERV